MSLFPLAPEPLHPLAAAPLHALPRGEFACFAFALDPRPSLTLDQLPFQPLALQPLRERLAPGPERNYLAFSGSEATRLRLLGLRL